MVEKMIGNAWSTAYPSFDIVQIKGGEVVVWPGELERQSASVGEAWKPFQTTE
jgi:hypothetical protein